MVSTASCIRKKSTNGYNERGRKKKEATETSNRRGKAAEEQPESRTVRAANQKQPGVILLGSVT